MDYADIINVTENTALFSYELEKAGFAVLNIDGVEFKSVEATGTGRFAVAGLEPGHSYHAELSGIPLDFTTLPAPEGEELGRFAIISEPHVSLKDENRKERFFSDQQSEIPERSSYSSMDSAMTLPKLRTESAESVISSKLA